VGGKEKTKSQPPSVGLLQAQKHKAEPKISPAEATRYRLRRGAQMAYSTHRRPNSCGSQAGDERIGAPEPRPRQDPVPLMASATTSQLLYPSTSRYRANPRAQQIKRRPAGPKRNKSAYRTSPNLSNSSVAGPNKTHPLAHRPALEKKNSTCARHCPNAEPRMIHFRVRITTRAIEPPIWSGVGGGCPYAIANKEAPQKTKNSKTQSGEKIKQKGKNGVELPSKPTKTTGTDKICGCGGGWSGATAATTEDGEPSHRRRNQTTAWTGCSWTNRTLTKTNAFGVNHKRINHKQSKKKTKPRTNIKQKKNQDKEIKS